MTFVAASLFFLGVGMEALYVIPGLRDAASELREERGRLSGESAKELERVKLLDEARKREVLHAAAILAQQEEALRVSKELIERLRKENRDRKDRE